MRHISTMFALLQRIKSHSLEFEPIEIMMFVELFTENIHPLVRLLTSIFICLCKTITLEKML